MLLVSDVPIPVGYFTCPPCSVAPIAPLLPRDGYVVQSAALDHSADALAGLSSSGSLRAGWLSQARICSLSWPSAGGGSVWRGGVSENEIGWRIIGTASAPEPTSTMGFSPSSWASLTPPSMLLIGPHGTPAAFKLWNHSLAVLVLSRSTSSGRSASRLWVRSSVLANRGSRGSSERSRISQSLLNCPLFPTAITSS